MAPGEEWGERAGAGRIGDALFEVLKYDVFGDGTVCGRKIAPAPKPLSPIALLQCGELSLDQKRRPTFDLPHEVADRELGRD